MRGTIEVPTVADLPALHRIALQAGDAGTDATGRYADPDLVGHVYAGPYLVADPGACRVLVLDSRVVGFCVATADSRGFEQWCERTWWPALRHRYPIPDAQDTRNDATLVRLIHRPHRTPAVVAHRYPAHLHINLALGAQGLGGGRRLIEAVHRELISRGVAGVHLGVEPANTHAIGFYRHLGYDRLDVGEPGLFGKTLL